MRTGQKSFLLVAVVAWATLVSAAASGASRGRAGDPADGASVLGASTQPNVLIVVMDDQRADYTLGVMPKTRKIFKAGGTRFTNGFATTPLCCPARSSIYSGRYAHNHDVHTNSDLDPQLDHSATIQRYLQDAGYLTGIVGKVLVQWRYVNDPPYWDHWATFNGGYWGASFNVNGTMQSVPGYTTQLVRDFANRFLGEFENTDDTPWLLYVAGHAPHKDFSPAPQDVDADVGTWDGNPAVLETDVSDKAPWAHWQWDLDRARALREAQLRTLLSADRMVKSIFDRMTALGEQDTIAFFLSDNGFLWGEHKVGADKRFPYLPAVKVPFMVRWPGHVAAGARDDRLVANIDLLPTILDATNVTPSLVAPLDGRSLFDPTARSRLLLEYYRSPDLWSVRSWAGFVKPTSQYVEWYDDDLSTVLFREYYDLANDPWQLVNLLHDGKAGDAPNVAALSAELQDLRDCVGASCP